MAKKNAKGTQENPYTMSEYETMADAGTWEGGYVVDDNGNVTYMMKELTVSGYSCGSHKSGSGSWNSEFASYSSHHDDTNPDNGDDKYGNGGSGGSGSGAGGSGGSSGGNGGGSGHTQNNNANNGQNGTFLYGAKFYTEKEYLQMQEAGTWTGGNVYTLGYIGIDHVISSGLSLIDSCDLWLTKLGNYGNTLRSWLNDINNKIMSSPYAQAVERYRAGTGEPLYFNVDILGLDNLKKDFIKENNTVNLLNPSVLISLMSGKSIQEQAKTLSAALTLGNISVTNISENTYKIETDTYDFEPHPWKTEWGKNIATIIGHVVCETICTGLDNKDELLYLTVGAAISHDLDIVLGRVAIQVIYNLYNRPNTKFDIYFNGTITLQE